MMNFEFFKSGSIKNTAIHAQIEDKSDFCNQLMFLEVLVTFYNNGIKFWRIRFLIWLLAIKFVATNLHK